MPAGVYRYDDGRAERFSCAPGPSGWRYAASYDDGARVDLTCDTRWRPVRLEAERPGGGLLRGGIVGRELAWVVHGAGAVAERQERAATFSGDSPSYAVATARLLGLATGAAARVRLVRVAADLSAVAVTHRWALARVETHPTESGPLRVETYDVTDAVTGDRWEWHLAGDVALAGPGVELAELSGPPSPVHGGGSGHAS